MPWTYRSAQDSASFGKRDWIEDAHGNCVVEHIGHIDGPAICAAVNALSRRSLDTAGGVEAVDSEVGECRYCANTGWFYGDPDLNTLCGCAFGTLRQELTALASRTPNTEMVVKAAFERMMLAIEFALNHPGNNLTPVTKTDLRMAWMAARSEQIDWSEDAESALASPPSPAQASPFDERDATNLLSVIADIREKSGVGAKPMLSELADAIAARIASPAQTVTDEPFSLNPLHIDLLKRGSRGKFIWFHDRAELHTSEMVAVGQLCRAGMAKRSEPSGIPGPPEMPGFEITDEGRAALTAALQAQPSKGA